MLTSTLHIIHIPNTHDTAGSEHRSWVLYYSLPVLKDVLPITYFEHYCHFVASIYILYGDNITENDLKNCEKWMTKFYSEYTDLYGKKMAYRT